MKNVLTKSMFKTGLICPRQLAYSLNKKDYQSKSINDPFLKALAKGGFQVGELANQYSRNSGVESFLIEQDNKELVLKITNDLLKKENVNIFEGAFLFNNCFVRCDIIEKRGNDIKIIEVKSKSMRESDFENIMDEVVWDSKKSMGRNDYDGVFNKQKAFGKNPKFYIKKDFEEYVFDIAFQAWVIKNSPESSNYNLSFYLCTPSQDLCANRDGINQKFLIKEENGKNKVVIRGKVNEEALGNKILAYHNVDFLVEGIHFNHILNIENFEKFILSLVEIVEESNNGEKNISSACKACPFNTNIVGKINGFNQCMSEHTGYDISEFETRKTVFDLWNNPDSASRLLREGEDRQVFLDDMTDKFLDTGYSRLQGKLSYDERKRIQVTKEIMGDDREYLNKSEISKELKSFKYPLHFLDFETAMTAIPYRKGQSPYQMIFFQFSHHVLEEDGTIHHAGQYINLEPFKNPNIEAVRELYRQLKDDDGSIFRWSMHENTVLKKVAREIEEMEDEDCLDKEELLSFLDSICVGGEREMIDQWELYKRHHYLPETNGSNSIKHVLPAIMNKFKPLQEFLSKPVYGEGRPINSLNFKKISWIQKDENGKIKDPYTLLPKVFKEYDKEELDLLYGDDDLKNGGAAMMAYAICQFTQISMGERTRLEKALLRYCELDTFAMVMIHLYWEYKLGMFEEFGVDEETMIEYNNEEPSLVIV